MLSNNMAYTRYTLLNDWLSDAQPIG
jgi:hypothetical protein